VGAANTGVTAVWNDAGARDGDGGLGTGRASGRGGGGGCVPHPSDGVLRLFVEISDRAEALPGLHARLPHHGGGIDQAEAKRVVELIDVHAFHVVASDHHMPDLIVSK